jgi:hypothetical protein
LLADASPAASNEATASRSPAQRESKKRASVLITAPVPPTQDFIIMRQPFLMPAARMIVAFFSNEFPLESVLLGPAVGRSYLPPPSLARGRSSIARLIQDPVHASHISKGGLNPRNTGLLLARAEQYGRRGQVGHSAEPPEVGYRVYVLTCNVYRGRRQHAIPVIDHLRLCVH